MEIVIVNQKPGPVRYCICADCDRTSLMNQFGQCTFCLSESVVVIRKGDPFGKQRIQS